MKLFSEMLKLSKLNLNHYKTLNLPTSASIKDIKSSFRQKSLKCHPDKFPNDKSKEDQFKKLSEAYQILSDGELKGKYDLELGLANNYVRKNSSGLDRAYKEAYRSDFSQYHRRSNTLNNQPKKQSFDIYLKIIKFFLGVWFLIIFVLAPIKAAQEAAKSGTSWQDRRRKLLEDRYEKVRAARWRAFYREKELENMRGRGK